MEFTPGHGSFSPKPKSPTNPHMHVQHGYMPQQHPQQLAHSHINGGAVGYIDGPSGSGASNAYGGARPKEPRQPQQYNPQQFQQYHWSSPRQQQPPQPQRYMNGGHPQPLTYMIPYQQPPPPQQQQMYPAQLNSLAASVQEHLQISGADGGAAGNKFKYVANGYQNQPPRHPNHHNKHNRPQYQSNHHSHHNQQQQQHYNQQKQQQHQQQHQVALPLPLQQQPQPQPPQLLEPQHQGGAVAAPSEVETVALDFLQTVIQCLNQTPGQFDTMATRFLTIFDGLESNMYVLSIAMEDIFEESLQNPNFRYMGARLYNLLHMLNLKRDSLFHTLLKCKLDYHQQEVAQYMQSNQQGKVRETALFLAELYMQLRSDDSRIQLIAENIVYSLQQLLAPRGGEHSAEDIRCICQTLKLAGYDLTTDCAAQMPQIIAQLDAINTAAPGKFPIVGSVIQLQRSNWGREINSSNSLGDPETAKPLEPLRMSDEPIFYGPDGRELTAEECAFMNGAGAMNGSTDEENVGGSDGDLDPEMDEETEQAYKEFCKLNANGKA